MHINKTTDLDSVFYYWPSKWYFNTDLKNIFSSDLENIFTTDLDSDIFTTTIFYYWPLEWYSWGGCPPEQPVACDWSLGTGPGSLHCLSDGSCTEIPWCCASSITPSTSRYNHTS